MGSELAAPSALGRGGSLQRGCTRDFGHFDYKPLKVEELPRMMPAARRGRRAQNVVPSDAFEVTPVDGEHAKEIGRALGISPRTVEVHKARIMEKLDARSVAELVRLVVRAEEDGADR